MLLTVACGPSAEANQTATAVHEATMDAWATQRALTPPPPPRLRVWDMAVLPDDTLAIAYSVQDAEDDLAERGIVGLFEIGRDGASWYINQIDERADLRGEYVERTPDGQYFVVGPSRDLDGTVSVVDVDTLEVVQTFPEAQRVAIHGDQIAVAGDEIVQLMDFETGEVLQTFEYPSFRNSARSIYFDGEYITTLGQFSAVTWTVSDGEVREFSDAYEPLDSITNAEGVVFTTDQGIVIFDPQEGYIQDTLLSRSEILNADLTSDGEWLATQIHDPGRESPVTGAMIWVRNNIVIFQLDPTAETLRLQETEPNSWVLHPEGRHDAFADIAFLNDKGYLIGLQWDRDLYIWDYRERVEMALFGLDAIRAQFMVGG